MTSISPSQEAREAAATLLAYAFGEHSGATLDAKAGDLDNHTFVRTLAEFEAQIEARRTPPSDELRRRIEDLISAAMNSAITEEWEVARHTADAIIALMPSGGGKKAQQHRADCEFSRAPIRLCDCPAASPELVEKEPTAWSISKARHEAKSAPCEQVEGDAVERVAKPASAWLIERRVDPPQWSTVSDPTGVGAFFSDVQRAHRFPTKEAAGHAMRRMSITPAQRAEYFVSEHIWMDDAAMPSPLPSDLVERLRKLLEEATQDVPKGAGWLWPSLAKNRAQIELRNWQSYLPALLDAIEGKK